MASLGDSLFYRTPSSSSSATGKSFLPSDAPSPGAAQLCHPRIILAQELLSAALGTAPAGLPGDLHAALCSSTCPVLTGVNGEIGG